jgi:hypothetical protein
MKIAAGKARRTVAILTACVIAVGCAVLADAQTALPSARRLAAMKADHKRPPSRPVENPALVGLGRTLF